MATVTTDRALNEVSSALLAMDPGGYRLARVFRSTFDQLYDGQNTGRYHLSHLYKTEKTHFGTLIEINIQRELQLNDGETLDFNIAGHEVDCKYSHTAQWMLPIESFDQLVLVTEANDETSVWSVGLVRVTKENRRKSENRDRKTGLNRHGRSQISWLYRNIEMPPNTLLKLPESITAEIMSGASGQARINTLFRKAVNLRIPRSIIATVAQQQDYMKRVRANGGARTLLQREGYLILSGDYSYQVEIAASLGANVPASGEFVSLRVVPDDSDAGIRIGSSYWRLATEDEKLTDPAPDIPR